MGFTGTGGAGVIVDKDYGREMVLVGCVYVCLLVLLILLSLLWTKDKADRGVDFCGMSVSVCVSALRTKYINTFTN